jgi:type II restriction/modification system DNA methylase subunit YeeA
LRAGGPRTLEEAAWPKADVIVGNPPFLGDKMMRGEQGDAYVDDLRGCFEGRVPGGADLDCYWFYKAGKQILAGEAKAAGLVATKSIRGGANRKVLDAIVNSTRIFEAWSDEPWINDGAAVRVSLVAFGEGSGCRLDGREVTAIHADLTAGAGVDLTKARRLQDNAQISFQGSQKIGALDIEGKQAREWLKLPNPNGKPSSDVVKPTWNGFDVLRRSQDRYVIDFGSLPVEEASLYEAPFQHVDLHVRPIREQNKDKQRRTRWWLSGRSNEKLRGAVRGLKRFIVTARVSKHRIFRYLNSAISPDTALVVIARDDDTTFGILSSRFHELWSLGVCTWLGVGNDPRYTPTTCFETFPFPPGLNPHDKGHNEAIAAAAHRLNDLRENWLNPPEWVEWQITLEEEKAGFPPRPCARPGHEAELKKRTLTNLYNARPAWLVSAHAALDEAVAAAYGWPDYTQDMTDEEILRRLLALNRA